MSFLLAKSLILVSKIFDSLIEIGEREGLRLGKATLLAWEKSKY